MINNLLSLLTYENIYLIANWGVIPFWLLLMFIPNHPITNFFTQSIIPPLLLAIAYAYLSYLRIKNRYHTFTHFSFTD